MKALALVFVALAAGSVPVFAQVSVNAGDLLIYRVGSNSGTDTLVNTGNSVFIDEWTTAGTYVRSYATGVIASGTASSEGLLNNSPDGAFMAFTGYATTSATSLSSTTASAVNRAVGVLATTTGAVSQTNFTDFASGNNPRSAVTTNGTDLWMAGGAGGVRYGTSSGTTSTQLSTTVANIRDVKIINNQLFVSDSSGTAVRLGAVGTGVPTTSGQTISNLSGFPTSTGSPYSFFFADLSSTVAGLDTLYVADDAAGIQKYSLVGTSWALTGTATASGVRGLTGIVSGGNVQLFGTTGSSGAAGTGALYSLLDGSGYNATLSGAAATLATNATLQAALGGAGSSYAFRGIAFAPIPEPSTYALFAGAIGLVAAFRRQMSRREVRAG